VAADAKHSSTPTATLRAPGVSVVGPSQPGSGEFSSGRSVANNALTRPAINIT